MKRKIIKILKKILPFKSQKDQDLWVILSVFPFRRNGYFLDLAAANGVLHNNTYVLEKFFNWKGICIEPNPHFFKKLQENRSCNLENCAVSNANETVQFRIDNGQLGGIVADDTDNNMSIRSEELGKADIIELETELLNDILERNNAPKEIDYFSLDVEGSEERIIRSINFEKYLFRCMTIERPTPAVNSILFENGYLFVKNYMNDTFYVHNSVLQRKKIKLEKFEQIGKKNW